jgi:uncharacterized iron-regulated membrane protein
MSITTQPAQTLVKGIDYRTVWRWHFYAGLFCIPFVLWLSVTGTIYLFKPQVEKFLDHNYDHLTFVHRASANQQVQAALAAVPGSTLDAFQLPRSDQSTAQILVDKGTQQFRVYVHPETLQVLHLVNEDMRLEKVVFRLHGELLMGDAGSWIVELAAGWAVVMILSGLYLWWPRDATALGGVIYPRLKLGKRAFWRDIHAVTGIYVSLFALFLLFSGLPWAKSWGGYLKAWRHLANGHAVHLDWTTGSSEDLAARAMRTSQVVGMEGGEHSMHGHHMEHAKAAAGGYPALDQMIATVAPLHLAYPVLISPPVREGGNWTAKSDTQNRPERVDLVLDAGTGAIVKRTDFRQRKWLDRVIGTSVAAHEGQLFGVMNQILSLFTAASLFLLAVSGLVMWWRRRDAGALGAPPRMHAVRLSRVFIAFLIALGIYQPILGASMILVLLTERYVLRRIPAVSTWLGLGALVQR